MLFVVFRLWTLCVWLMDVPSTAGAGVYYSMNSHDSYSGVFTVSNSVFRDNVATVTGVHVCSRWCTFFLAVDLPAAFVSLSMYRDVFSALRRM